MSFKKKVAAAVTAVGVATTVAVGGFASPAFAASTTCIADDYWVVGARTCKTGTIKSNKNHDLRVVVTSEVYKCKESPWHVWDVDTGKTVASGKKVPRNVVINGLYGKYKGRLDGACYQDMLTLRDW